MLLSKIVRLFFGSKTSGISHDRNSEMCALGEVIGSLEDKVDLIREYCRDIACIVPDRWKVCVVALIRSLQKHIPQQIVEISVPLKTVPTNTSIEFIVIFPSPSPKPP